MGLSNQRFKLGLVGDAGGYCHRFATFGLNLLDHRLAGVQLAAGHHHLGPRLGQLERDGAANAPAGAGDNGHLAF
jgi:hypothetical protein